MKCILFQQQAMSNINYTTQHEGQRTIEYMAFVIIVYVKPRQHFHIQMEIYDSIVFHVCVLRDFELTSVLFGSPGNNNSKKNTQTHCHHLVV